MSYLTFYVMVKYVFEYVVWILYIFRNVCVGQFMLKIS